MSTAGLPLSPVLGPDATGGGGGGAPPVATLAPTRPIEGASPIPGLPVVGGMVREAMVPGGGFVDGDPSSWFSGVVERTSSMWRTCTWVTCTRSRELITAV